MEVLWHNVSLQLQKFPKEIKKTILCRYLQITPSESAATQIMQDIRTYVVSPVDISEDQSFLQLTKHIPNHLYCSVLASFQPSVVFYSDSQSLTGGQGGKAFFPYCPAVFTSCKSVNY